MKRKAATSRVLEDLYMVIQSRRRADPKVSHTARLFKKGRGKIAQKTGEEAVEVIVAALHESPKKVTAESADLLYHLLVLWAERGVRPAQVFRELSGRMGVSGIAEKKSRGKKKKRKS
jgi:phosphoribosyl-ATP pyrophosphohydrolase